LIAALFAQHRGTYGAPRIAADLTEMGWRVSQNTVAALMAEQGLKARTKRRRRATTRPGRGRWHAPDLVNRDFSARRLNQRWFGDGTEIDTAEGKLQLASVLDVRSRRVLGFALSEHHDTELAYGSLAMAVAVRGGQVGSVVLHTDRGSEYTAGSFRAACVRLGITQSMGRPGSALDNSMIESWHSTLEFELRSREKFETKAAARARVAAWIDEISGGAAAMICLRGLPARTPRRTAPTGTGGLYAGGQVGEFRQNGLRIPGGYTLCAAA
jgi:transposase InsO family protein